MKSEVEGPFQGKKVISVWKSWSNALHATRSAFIVQENCSRLKALMAKMKPNTEVFDNGDLVYYKRERDD